jgi:hypothetical protein
LLELGVLCRREQHSDPNGECLFVERLVAHELRRDRAQLVLRDVN